MLPCPPNYMLGTTVFCKLLTAMWQAVSAWPNLIEEEENKQEEEVDRFDDRGLSDKDDQQECPDYRQHPVCAHHQKQVPVQDHGNTTGTGTSLLTCKTMHGGKQSISIDY